MKSFNRQPSIEVVKLDLSAETIRTTDEFSMQIEKIDTKTTMHEDFDINLEITYKYSYAVIATLIHFIHLVFGPISLPILWMIFGRNLSRNMGFYWHRFYYMEFYPWSWTLFTLIFYIYYKDEFQNFLSLTFATVTIMCVKTFMVSVKYGFYTEELWNRMNTEIVDTQILKIQLILNAWLKIPNDVIWEELAASIARQNRLIDKLCLIFENEIHEELKNKFTNNRKNSQKEHESVPHYCRNKICIPTIELAKFIIQDVAENIKPKILIVTLISIQFSLSPLISILYQNRHINFGPIQIFYSAYSIIACFILSHLFLLYVYIGIIDLQRKKSLMNQCSALISTKNYQNSLLQKYHIPKLDFLDKRTVDSWYIMRSSFLDFGRKFTYRILVYASLAIPLCFFMLAILILQAFLSFHIISISIMIGAIYLAFASLFMILYIIFIGAQINRSFSIHEDSILTIINDNFHLKNCDKIYEKSAFKALKLVKEKVRQD
ncbi:unnamed protein product [Blepharisma stoltei]|uniref:Odorant receptor n=1 Tax=Blepharisma stoltei TaxID=1481888 RepID=A0AAU9J3D1_9CILI|nr:unnamed protein product [Blepharisma stoltei]